MNKKQTGHAVINHYITNIDYGSGRDALKQGKFSAIGALLDANPKLGSYNVLDVEEDNDENGPCELEININDRDPSCIGRSILAVFEQHNKYASPGDKFEILYHELKPISEE